MTALAMEPDSVHLEPQPDIIGPYGKLPTVARDLNTKETKSFEISPLEEMRLEVETEQIHIWMSKGQSEIFGSELSTDRIYTFLKGTKLSIWSYTGCQLQIQGDVPSMYKTKESRIMTTYFNFHNCLEEHRTLASQRDSYGPRVLVIGQPNTGRSTFCRILLNYAARMRSEDRRNPIFVDLDLAQPDLAVPGTIACCQLDRPADAMYDFLFQRKYVLPYGHLSVDNNPDLLNGQIRRMGEIMDIKMAKDRRAKHSGMIINAFAYQKNHGHSHIFAIAKAFKVDFIVILEIEGLHKGLKSLQKRALEHDPSVEEAAKTALHADLQIIFMNKSRGVLERSSEEKRVLRENRIKLNIYGHPLRAPKHEPHVHEMDFAEIIFCELGRPHLNVTLLPSTVNPAVLKAAAYPITPTLYHKNRVIYVTSVETVDKVNSEGSVIGYLLVKEVDQQNRKITFMSNFLEIPKKVLLTSDISLKL